MSIRKLLVCLALAIVLAVSSAVRVSAHYFNPVVRPDVGDHAYCFGDSVDGKPSVRAAMTNSMNNFGAQTAYAIDGPNACTDATDVFFRELNLSGTIRGRWQCRDANTSQSPFVCRSAFVTLDADQIAADGGGYERNLRKTACHEVGHSGGLDHGYAHSVYDCMLNGSVSGDYDTYNADHVRQINSLRP